MKTDLGWKSVEDARSEAQRVLPVLVHEYFNAGRKLTPASSAKTMHRFRLRTKRLRYTLEAFVMIYGHGINRRCASLRPIQNALGEANDCAVLLKESGETLPPGVRTWLEERTVERRNEFLRYWKEEFDALDEEKKWIRYLTRTYQPKTTTAHSAA
jgi:CHAD domain-containing protein